MFFSEKNTFFTENERFSRLIRFYARRLNEVSAADDLWGFLWILKATAKKPLTDNYIAVCLRNEFIRMSKAKAALPLCVADFTSFGLATVDKPCITMDIEKAFESLSLKESEILRLHYVGGYSIDELSKIKKISRQAINKTKLNGLNKMRIKLLGLDK